MALLKHMLCKRVGLVITTICISILAIIVSLWWNSQLSYIINAINSNTLIPVRTLAMMAATILVNSGVAYALGLLSGWTCETLAHDLRMGYARHFTTLSLTEIEKLNAGEQLSKLQNEITDVSGFLRTNLFSIVDDGVRFIATFSWMLSLNPRLTIFANLPVVLIIWYTTYSSKVIGDMVQQSQKANEQMNGFVDMLVSVFPILRIFNASPLLCGKYDNVLKQWEALSIKEECTRAKLMSLSAFLSCLPLLLLFLIGGSQVISGGTTLGTLYIFINLSGNVSGIMMNMPGRIAAFRRFSTNMERLQPSVLLEDGRCLHGRAC